MDVLESTAANDADRISKTQAKYVMVNGTWPRELPPLSAVTAKKAFRVLYRYRFHHKWTLPVVAVKGSHRRTWVDWIKVGRKTKGGYQRQVSGMVVAPDAGWHSFIHDLSHWMHRKQYPDQNAHKGSSHAAVERDLIEEVLRRGWLNEKPKVKAAKVKPDLKAKRHVAVLESIKAWETKLKRANTALKKLRRKKAYYERQVT